MFNFAEELLEKCKHKNLKTVMTIKNIKERLYLELKDYVMIIVGLVIYSFGFCAFILPQNVVIGGYTTTQLTLYNPASGKKETVSRSAYEKIFKGAGNHFISYMTE